MGAVVGGGEQQGAEAATSEGGSGFGEPGGMGFAAIDQTPQDGQWVFRAAWRQAQAGVGDEQPKEN